MPKHITDALNKLYAHKLCLLHIRANISETVFGVYTTNLLQEFRNSMLPDYIELIKFLYVIQLQSTNKYFQQTCPRRCY